MAALEQGEGDHPHIEFTREPDINPERRRPKGFGHRVQPRANLGEHAHALEAEANEALTVIGQARSDTGIDPSRLIVIEFTALDQDQREVFEKRFEAEVVDEAVTIVDGREIFRTVVQFLSVEALRRFQAEIGRYAGSLDERDAIPLGERRRFFDSLESIRALSREDRLGPRLKAEGFPDEQEFFLDVDLWHPGNADESQRLITQFSDFCIENGARITDRVRTASLLLFKVRTNRAFADRIADLDVVACVDLPPKIHAAYSSILNPGNFPNPTIVPEPGDPLACVIDSGVVAGHPYLVNWVIEEIDLDSGEDTPVDRNGHGTAVAGLVVYGDVAACIATGIWHPRVQICSAKILRNDPDPFDPDRPSAVFPPENRIEHVVERAIRAFHEQRHCRVFNLSVGDDSNVYAGQRQFPLAEKLDELARELDIVIVVAAGNRPKPPIPDNCNTRQQLQEAVRNGTLSPEQRVCSPATAALAVTVGSIARSDSLQMHQNREGAAVPDAVPASPHDAPSPFTRTGPGYNVKLNRALIKPEFVGYGGNYAIQTLGAEPQWRTEHLLLGEPTLQLERNGRFLGSKTGTSFACPQITHISALSEKSLELAIVSFR